LAGVTETNDAHLHLYFARNAGSTHEGVISNADLDDILEAGTGGGSQASDIGEE